MAEKGVGACSVCRQECVVCSLPIGWAKITRARFMCYRTQLLSRLLPCPPCFLPSFA